MRKTFFHNNGLVLVFLFLFILSLTAQFITGRNEYNNDRKADGYPPISSLQYIKSGHFISSTFENWESEFLQMALFVLLTRAFRQKGSSESKKLEGKEAVDREPDTAKKDTPWPVHKGGLILELYKHSLSIVLLLLYLFTFCMHAYGSYIDFDAGLIRKGHPAETFRQYIFSSRLWFESFQNWQSEFLSIVAIVILSKYLRQKGSPQSKPVDASFASTGN